jgi:hypothetical protein
LLTAISSTTSNPVEAAAWDEVSETGGENAAPAKEWEISKFPLGMDLCEYWKVRPPATRIINGEHVVKVEQSMWA